MFNRFKASFELLNNENVVAIKQIDKSRIDLFEKTENINLNIEQKDILRQKIHILNQQRYQYMNLISLLYKNYYALLSLFPYISGLTGVFVFIILQDGWKNTNIYIKSIFLILALLTAITGIFPEVYQQKENIDRYSSHYTKFSKVQRDIFNYNLTSPYTKLDDTLSFNKFLLKINAQEKELIDLHFGLEKKEISKDAFEITK
ncbi:hypothetical protein [uncultured Psychroserpens sp.]|uniref:hypothetical protein n=1 Tax=uncultured Psychroserpens sp. TaxID=255436 RepID=UPI002624EB07|nr:hypothetical protein [uncultured Psychroserpens sp.]